MDEAQHLADRIAVIDRGRIVAEGAPDTLGGRQDGATRIRFVPPPGMSASDIPLEGLEPGDDGYLRIDTESPTRDLHRLTSWAVGRGIELDRLEIARPSLEDVYLGLTGDD
jgi:ABC-2 type transport system ATP-binding protein